MLERHSEPLKERYNMHTIVHSIWNFYISVLSWIEYLRVIAVLLIKAPFDNAVPRCTPIHLLAFIIYATVIFSPFLLTNKIVIIEDITLSREAVFTVNGIRNLPSLKSVAPVPRGLLHVSEQLFLSTSGCTFTECRHVRVCVCFDYLQFVLCRPAQAACGTCTMALSELQAW